MRYRELDHRQEAQIGGRCLYTVRIGFPVLSKRLVLRTTLAMFLCVKTSPGFKPNTVVSGTRESLQPIHSTGGAWPLAEA